jgi:hypothetical protein
VTTRAADGAVGQGGAPGSSSVAGAAPTSWQIQLSGDIDTSFDVAWYEIDLDSPAIAALRAAGRTVACYFSAGTRESFRADAAQFPASAVGNALTDYPNESWLDIRDSTVVALMTARLDTAVARGCQAVDASNLDGFLSDTGFGLTRDDALGFARLLASAAHARGLSTVLGGGDAGFVSSLTSDYDRGLGAGCVMTSGCNEFASFLALGRTVFVAEFGDETSVPTVCPRAAELGLDAILKHPALDAFRVGCP